MWCEAMHELTIAMSLIEAVCDELPTFSGVRNTALHIRIGPLSLVMWCDRCVAERTLVSVHPPGRRAAAVIDLTAAGQARVCVRVLKRHPSGVFT